MAGRRGERCFLALQYNLSNPRRVHGPMSCESLPYPTIGLGRDTNQHLPERFDTGRCCGITIVSTIAKPGACVFPTLRYGYDNGDFMLDGGDQNLVGGRALVCPVTCARRIKRWAVASLTRVES